ncbi:DUF6082 family protein [Sphaerisporangium perillae]|uniref:DUF6082 family protein n=1 Tax=Sphaerisporangium perillae TaxID=2935860 RepID=UPI00200E5745|nr:DUF6082 family protein [Sphaerisporangium perillae]
MVRPWETNPSAEFKRRLGKLALELGHSTSRMEDPLYRRAWGPFFESEDPGGPREQTYVNLLVSQWAMEHELRTITEEQLRSLAHKLFSGPTGRRYWHDVRELRTTGTTTRGERRFQEILDEEYRRAGASPAHIPAQSQRPQLTIRLPHAWPAVALVTALVTTEILRRLLLSQRRRLIGQNRENRK